LFSIASKSPFAVFNARHLSLPRASNVIILQAGLQRNYRVKSGFIR
jgi:hypothetical protein